MYKSLSNITISFIFTFILSACTYSSNTDETNIKKDILTGTSIEEKSDVDSTMIETKVIEEDYLVNELVENTGNMIITNTKTGSINNIYTSADISQSQEVLNSINTDIKEVNKEVSDDILDVVYNNNEIEISLKDEYEYLNNSGQKITEFHMILEAKNIDNVSINNGFQYELVGNIVKIYKVDFAQNNIFEGKDIMNIKINTKEDIILKNIRLYNIGYSVNKTNGNVIQKYNKEINLN